MTTKEKDISEFFAPKTGATAAIALPPQMAVPADINKAGRLSTFKTHPKITPNTITLITETAVSRKPLFDT